MLRTVKFLSISSFALLASSSTLRPNTDLPPGLTLRVFQTSQSECATYDYIYRDYITHPESNFKVVCDLLTEGDISEIEGGELFQKKNGTCSFSKDHTLTPNKRICEYTGRKGLSIHEKTCPSDEALLSESDASLYYSSICAKVDFDTPVRAFNMIIVKEKKPDTDTYDCITKKDDGSSSVTKVVCVKPKLKKIKVENVSNDKYCDEGQSLLTFDEVNSKKSAYCDYIAKNSKILSPRYNTTEVRLAGGTVMNIEIKKSGEVDRCLLMNDDYSRAAIETLCASKTR